MNILGTASHETRPFLELTRNISHIYISEEIGCRITKKLSQEFNRIESRISDALSKLDEFLSNQQKQTHSKTVPGTFRNTNVENQGTNEDDSKSDPHPEAGIFRRQTTQTMAQKIVVTVTEKTDIHRGFHSKRRYICTTLFIFNWYRTTS